MTFHRLDRAGLEPWLPAYEALNARALEATGFNSPGWISAVTRHLGGSVAAVAEEGRLLAALPVRKRRLPFLLMETLFTDLGGSGAPVVDRDRPETLAALLSGLNQPLLLHDLPADDPLYALVREQAGHFAVIDQWQRGALRPHGSFDDWLRTNFDSKRRGRFRRNREKLGEGAISVGFESLAAGADCTTWIEGFLALEDAGWKGRRGTALARNAAARAAFVEATRSLHAAGHLRFWRIRRDGRTVASTWAIHERDRLWMVKIAYDESLARLSPGILLMLDSTAGCLAEPGLKVADSCAIPGHPMVDNFWRDRIAMADVMVAPASVSAARFAATVAAEKAYRKTRSTARDLVYRLLGRHRV
jgi:CelD/BcsL family acetyltransferase involved in cellulose biosynthesis